MLQEKEHRLCSNKYLLNDYEERKLVNTRSDSLQHQDFRGYFVFPDDATDIKSHPFFHGIPWDRLHLIKAPEIPDVKSCYDTKYFDEDEPISDVDDASSTSSIQEQELKAQEEYEQKIAAAFEAEKLNQENDDSTQIVTAFVPTEAATRTEIGGAREIILVDKKGDRGKDKKRPRDRILRDTKVAKQVLDIRKKGAFIGYTYRRPKPVVTSMENNKPAGVSVSRRLKISSIR